MDNKMKKIIWLILLILTVAFGIASIVYAGMPDEVLLSDGSIGYAHSPGECICHIVFVVSFSACLILGNRIKKNNRK